MSRDGKSLYPCRKTGSSQDSHLTFSVIETHLNKEYANRSWWSEEKTLGPEGKARSICLAPARRMKIVQAELSRP